MLVNLNVAIVEYKTLLESILWQLEVSYGYSWRPTMLTIYSLLLVSIFLVLMTSVRNFVVLRQRFVHRHSSLSTGAALRSFREHHSALIVLRRILIALYEELLNILVIHCMTLPMGFLNFRIWTCCRSGPTLANMLRHERIVAVLCFRLPSTILLRALNLLCMLLKNQL